MMESGHHGNTTSSSAHCGHKRHTTDDRCFNPDKDIMHSNKRQITSKSSLHLHHNISLKLHVRRTSIQGTSRVARLPLINITGVSDLRGLFRRLIYGAFSENVDELPDYLRADSDQFYMFTPEEDFVSLPGDTIQTQFKLVAVLEDGRQFVLAERFLGGVPDPARRFLVTVAEFESEPIAIERSNSMSNSGMSSDDAHHDGGESECVQKRTSPRRQSRTTTNNTNTIMNNSNNNSNSQQQQQQDDNDNDEQQQQHVVVSLVSYPTVSVQKDFLDAALTRLAEIQSSDTTINNDDAMYYYYYSQRCNQNNDTAAAAAMIHGISDDNIDNDNTTNDNNNNPLVAIPIIPLVADDDGNDDEDDHGQDTHDSDDDDGDDRSTFTSAFR